MEIVALSSPLSNGYHSPVRAAEGVVTPPGRIAPDSVDAAKRQDGVRGNFPESARSNGESTRPEAQKSGTPQPPANPRIQFKDSEGTRVMEIYDSNDVLIYQVPPKGQLLLIQNEENRPDSRFEASA